MAAAMGNAQSVRFWIACAVGLLGYVILAAWVPTLLPVDTSQPNAAARQGYHIGSLFPIIAGWSAVLAGAVFLASRSGLLALPGGQQPGRKAGAPPSLRGRLVEVAILVAAVFALYFPPIIVRNGPYTEDAYFLHTALRVLCGQDPYADFSFLYGPLMISLQSFWLELTGYTLENYYWLVAILNAAFFGGFLWWMQSAVPERRERIILFLLLLPALADLLMGLNYLPWRRMLPVIALLVICAGPFDWRRIAVTAGILAVSGALSYEFKAVGLISVGGVYAALLLSPAWRESLVKGPVLAAASLLGTTALVFILTNDNSLSYVNSVAHVSTRASELGLGAFRFYWTAHSLAVFALFALGLVVVGAGLGRLAKVEPTPRDLFLVGAVVFAVFSTRIAVQRADLWHMTFPAIALTLAVLLPGERRWFPIDRNIRRSAYGAVASASVFAAIGLFPTADRLVRAYADGARDVLGGEDRGVVNARLHTVLNEISDPDEAIAALAEFLAAPEYARREVYLYSSAWEAASALGACPAGYTFYDIPYSEGMRNARDDLEALSDPLVIMRARDFEALMTGEYPERRRRRWRKRDHLADRLSTVHLRQREIENQIEHEMWRDAVGQHIADSYQEVTRIGEFVILERRDRRGDAE
ncbi:hypothetical protein [Parvularcula lutaonensis]|uniref:Glycosyltransferase RgtA/B/C/D-like domain-containing protein n=1 Tax=Parvularcula lutaonensis TaxID=491923 RepID=A0ABV7MDZ1_9PROT|nr:hypothetical protein [Parvularcula lutaonensis]